MEIREVQNILLGLAELLASATREFYSQSAQNFIHWLLLAGGITVFIAIVFFISGRLVRNDWKPNYILSSLAGIALPLSFFLIFLLPASSYLKPAISKHLEYWQQIFLADEAWKKETFIKEYWKIKALKNPDGSALEDFSNFPAPKDGGISIPASNRTSQIVMADFESSRTEEHFQQKFPFLAKLLWTQGEYHLSEVLSNDMKWFFKTNPDTPYTMDKSVRLAGVEMQNILEQKIQRIVLITRIALVLFFVILWLPLLTYAMYDAWKKLEPIRG